MKELLATNTGWILRQGLKLITIAGASISAWLIAHDVTPEHAEGITVGVVTGLSWLLELGLSNIAKKVAVPLLAFACLTMTSCLSTAQKAEFKIRAKEIGLQIAEASGKAAATVALNTAKEELTKRQNAKPPSDNTLAVMLWYQGLEEAQKLVDQAQAKVDAFSFSHAKQPADVQP